MGVYYRGAGHKGLRPRSNLGSHAVSGVTNEYNPFYAEGINTFHRYDSRLPQAPTFPRIITLPPATGFMHPCNRHQVERRLQKLPPQSLKGLRAVFLLSGNRKQLRSWYSNLACYGYYWNDCVFLCAHPVNLGEHNLDSIRDMYLDDVLVHEVGHHVDRERDGPHQKKENFADGFAEQLRWRTLPGMI